MARLSNKASRIESEDEDDVEMASDPSSSQLTDGEDGKQDDDSDAFSDGSSSHSSLAPAPVAGPPKIPMKIKLTLGNQSGRSIGSTAGSIKSKGKKKSKNSSDEFSEEDELSNDRAKDFSKMTARQRAAQGGEGDEPLVQLQEGSKALQLTAAEKEAKKAETARRRKNQSEKKLEDDKIETVNRLLKAQSSRSRGKASAALLSASATHPDDPAVPVDPSDTPLVIAAAPPTLFRTIHSVRSGEYTASVSAPFNPSYLSKLNSSTVDPTVGKRPKGVCSVSGCGKERKYRCVGGPERFEQGGCGMEHLKIVQAGL